MTPRFLLRAISLVRVPQPGRQNVVRFLADEEAYRWAAGALGVSRQRLVDVALGRTDFSPELWLKAEAVLGVPATLLQRSTPSY